MDDKLSLPEGVGDHGALQRKVWAAQRVAWVVFAAILIACLLGAFGRDGPLARSTAVWPEAIVDFPVITRWNAPDEIKVTFSPSPADRVFLVDARFFDTFSVESVDPPQKGTLAKNGMTGYVFPSDPSNPTQVTFRLQTQSPGLKTLTFGAEGRTAEHDIFVFP